MDLSPAQLDALHEGFAQLNASPNEPTPQAHTSMRKTRKNG